MGIDCYIIAYPEDHPALIAGLDRLYCFDGLLGCEHIGSDQVSHFTSASEFKEICRPVPQDQDNAGYINHWRALAVKFADCIAESFGGDTLVAICGEEFTNASKCIKLRECAAGFISVLQ